MVAAAADDDDDDIFQLKLRGLYLSLFFSFIQLPTPHISTQSKIRMFILLFYFILK